MRDLARLPLNENHFRDRYGQWAVIAGASEGTGACFARQLAGMGLNLVLVSRRQTALHSLGEELAEKHGVEFRSFVQDLTETGA